jgi:Secretory lipase
MTATQVLYRTDNQLGQPTATVATILSPATAGPVKLLSYQTAYDGLAPTTRPSYALRSGDIASNAILGSEALLMNGLLGQGYTLVTSDYEGPTDDFGAGRESGQGTLDGIRAAESALKLAPATTPVALMGYSGGSIATMWAAQLQARYAPDLDVIGAAAGGIPVDFSHNLAYISGDTGWQGAIPSILLGLARAYHVNLDQALNARGRRIMTQVAGGILQETRYPGLRLPDLLKPKYGNTQKVPEFVKLFNDTIMGRDGTPKMPLYLAVGNDDGTGDGVMIAKDIQQLAQTYCAGGDSVQFQVFDGQDHAAAAASYFGPATTFLAGLYSGAAAADGCAAITPGNPLTPTPAPKGPSTLIGTGISLAAVSAEGSHQSMFVGAPTSALSHVRLTVQRNAGHGRFTTVKTVSVGAVAAYTTRPVPFTFRAVKGARYRVVVSGLMGTETVQITGPLPGQ